MQIWGSEKKLKTNSNTNTHFLLCLNANTSMYLSPHLLSHVDVKMSFDVTGCTELPSFSCEYVWYNCTELTTFSSGWTGSENKNQFSGL